MWSRLVAFFDVKEPATPLALVRMLAGLSAFLTLQTVWRHDLIRLIWTSADNGGYRPIKGDWFVQLLGGPTESVMTGLVIAGMLSSFLLMVGLGGRLTAVVTLQLILSTTDANGHTGGSYDEVLSNVLWLVLLAPSTRTLSLDCRLRTGAWRDDTPVAGWVRFLLLWQLILMYWTTGLQKVSAHWVPGGGFSALYYILQQPTWQRWDHAWTAYVYPLTQLGTATSWFWEVSAPLWLLSWWYARTAERPGRLRHWFNRLHVREIYLVLGLTFHFWLTVLMNVGPFAICSLAMYPALYSHSEWVRAGRWAWRKLPTRAAAVGVGDVP